MPLEDCLRNIRELHDLPALFATLGYEPLWHELPDGALVGRAGEFMWVGCTLDGGDASAMTRAAHLGRGGRIAGVAGLDRGTQTLHLAIGYHGAPSCRVQLGALDAVDLSRLDRLRPEADEPALTIAARVAEALATEPVGDRFFRQFRRALDLVRDNLAHRAPPADRHALALLQLTRVLVLYFVQAKGWLDNNPRFLRQAVDDCLAGGRSIQRNLLRPLFFGVLNRPPGQRGKAVHRLGRIPFLNGGLFEPHPLERRWPADLPSSIWLQIFDDLFERFHFVLRGQEGPGIAPDMLGRVFEGVMDPGERLASGSFYTPATLVDAVLKAAFVAYLSSHLRVGESAAERELADPSPRTRALLESVTILDPAVGSGAFLLGGLRLLAAPWSGSTAVLAARKRAIASRNLFGVDRNANAVRLAELRLWLEVIAADPAEDPAAVSPLPNLDALLRQGDSLADPIQVRHASDNNNGDSLATTRRQYASATGAEKRALARRLRALERDGFRQLLSRQLEHLEWRIRDLLGAGRAAGLFDTPQGLDRSQQHELTALRASRTWLRQQLRRTTRDEVLPWFHYQSHFTDVFAGRGGFDLIVGNPPWIRSDRLAPEERAALAARYRWMKPQRTGKGFVSMPDVSVAFLERATELAAPGGVVSMLVPAKLATAGYAAGARASLAASTTLHLVADISASHASAFDATVYPLALVFARKPPGGASRVRDNLGDGARTLQSTLQGGGPWVIVADPLRKALDHCRADHPSLDTRYRCHLGVKTGCNKVFLAAPEDVEPEMTRAALRGRDLSAFRADAANRILWTHDEAGNPLRTLPPRTRAWIERHRSTLLARRDYTGGPVWGLFRTRPASAAHRVVWADLARRLAAVPLVGAEARRMVPLNTCYLVPTADETLALRLAAWLNSTWIRAVARSQAVPAASGFARFNARVVGAVPFPDQAAADDGLLHLARQAWAQRAVNSRHQEDLDDLVAHHLDLGPVHRRALAGLLGPRTRARC